MSPHGGGPHLGKRRLASVRAGLHARNLARSRRTPASAEPAAHRQPRPTEGAADAGLLERVELDIAPGRDQP